MKNYFQGTEESPYHISIGAVVLNDENKVLCHYFGNQLKESDSRYPANFYILMRETIEPGESIEQALARGLQEEFSATAKMERYVGSQVYFIGKDNKIEKTTLYFLCRLETLSKERNLNDLESKSELRWEDIDVLIGKMKVQYEREKLPDLDESPILERVKGMLL